MKRFTSMFVLLLFLSFSLSTFLVPQAEAVENTWATKQPMPEALCPGVAVVNGKIYAISSSSSWEYDSVTNTWASKKSMPTPRHSFGIAVYQNKIYVIGGEIVDAKFTGVNEVYDPLTDTWETKTSMPTPRKLLDANAVNGKIYMIGGCQSVPNSDNLDVNEAYDPATDSWTTKAQIPTGVESYASAVVDNKIYVIGGFDCSLNQIYNTATDTWSYGTPIPTGVSGAAAAATTGVEAPKRIYVLGGFPYYEFLRTCDLNQVYDPETDTWSKGTSMPTRRSGLGVAVVNDVLYAIGGAQWFDTFANNEQYTPFGYGTVPQRSEPFPAWIVAAIVTIAVVGIALLIYFAKVKKTTGKAEIISEGVM